MNRDAPGRAIELPPGRPMPARRGWAPLVVARSTAYGVSAAARVIAAWPWWQAPRPWLVLVADAPVRPPLAVRYRLRALEPRTAGTAHVPYLHHLRAVDNPVDALTVPAVARAAAALLQQLTTQERSEKR
ncbi:hypothetical protein [Carbonactinospora thermoautotrophica]|uniref:hypothetical protein n=1 Tax=Carbonactinospora thermoautotrophica TaxID=1469144 RepID=UPI00227042B1|nr:hypothetical protein [Carbonactinospora thermoautotrophica]